MKRRILHHQGIVLACLLLACRAALGATNWYVRTDGNDSNDGTNWPTAFQTISNGVAHAITAGDTVLVSNGTYNVSNQISITVGITVRGVGGASNTIVSGGYPATTNRLFSMTDSNAVLDGLTITNGYLFNEYGGGVYMTCGTLQNCTVSGCWVTNTAQFAQGGGIYMSGGIVSNCTVSSNRAIGTYSGYTAGDGGGGICIASNGLVVDCQLSSNSAHHGGGIYCYNGTGSTVSNCTFRGNVASIGGYEPAGGGVYQSGGGPVVNCLFSGNSAVGGNAGGGAIGRYGGGIILNCRMIGNTSAGGGGAVADGAGNVTIRNCLISSNSAAGNGGAVSFSWGGTLENTTVSGNSAGNSGGGVVLGNSPCTLRNSIVYNNTALLGANYYENNPAADCYFTNLYSCTTPELAGQGGTTNDPRFVNAAVGDYRLLSMSPCINVGTNQSWMTNAVDLAGNARIIASIVDMGAYEFKSNTLQCAFLGDSPVGFTPHPVVFTAYVSGTNLTGLYYQWDYTGDGSFDVQGFGLQTITNTYTCGWFTVSLTVTNAAGEVASVTNVSYVHVGPATTYVSTVGQNTWPYTNWAMASTGIQAAVDAGVDGTLVLVTNGTYSITNQINVINGVTVRSMNGASNTTVRRAGPGNHRIFYLSHPTAVLDGLTITNGYETSGGGVYIQKPTGAGVESGGTVSNCTISGNTSGNYYGGGVYIWYGGLLDNCTISGNLAIGSWYGGGGILCFGGGTARNCVIQGNRVTGGNARGGGAYLLYGGTLRNCLVTGNTAKEANTQGGGVWNIWGLMANCTVSGNWGYENGGVYNYDASSCITNCIIYFNTASNTASAGTNIGPSLASVAFSCSPDLTNGVNGNITADPQFKDPGTGYGMYHSGGNFRLLNSSPCINKGTNAAWMATATDLYGLRRIITIVVDMGACEFQPAQGTVFVVH